MEQQRAAGSAERGGRWLRNRRDVAEFVEDDEIGIGEASSDLPGFTLVFSCSRALTSSSGKRTTGHACDDVRWPGRRWRVARRALPVPGPPTVRDTAFALEHGSDDLPFRFKLWLGKVFDLAKAIANSAASTVARKERDLE